MTNYTASDRHFIRPEHLELYCNTNAHLLTISPFHRLADMPRIPYHIVNDLADELFPFEQMDAYVEKLMALGHSVTYHRLEGCRHGELTGEEWDAIRAFLTAYLTRA